MNDRFSPASYEFDLDDGLRWGAGNLRRFQPSGYESVFAYSFDDLGVARATGHVIPPDAADLLDIVSVTHLADRVAPRPNASQRCSSRRMSLTIPVRLPELWTEPNVRQRLVHVLEFLTRDEWNLSFSQRVAPRRPAEIQSSLQFEVEHDSASVVLHSGGIDSLLGIATALGRNPDRLIAVSHRSNSRSGSLQSDILSRVRQFSDSDILSVSLKLGFTGLAQCLHEREPSQRTRGLLYLVLGSVVAHLSGSRELIIMENGPGAINLGYTDEHLGQHRSLAAHPKTLSMVESLIQAVLSPGLRIANPGLWNTKAELCRTLLKDGLHSLVGDTSSCDRFPWLSADRPCGACTSCVLRRMALLNAAIDDSASYGFDALAFDSILGSSDSRALYAVRWQAELLRSALDSASPDGELLSIFPEIADIVAVSSYLKLPPQEIVNRLLRLLRTHVHEWDQLADRLNRIDWRTQHSDDVGRATPRALTS